MRWQRVINFSLTRFIARFDSREDNGYEYGKDHLCITRSCTGIDRMEYCSRRAHSSSRTFVRRFSQDSDVTVQAKRSQGEFFEIS